MNTAKVYHDIDGNECTIFQMVRREPEWTASRFQFMEVEIERLTAECAEWVAHKAIRKRRGEAPPGYGCCCEFDDDDTQTRWCMPHSEMRDEIERLTAENERFKQVAVSAHEMMQESEAGIERLTAALQEISQMAGYGDHHTLEGAVEAAKNALEVE